METTLLVTLGAMQKPHAIGLSSNILRILCKETSNKPEYRSMLILSNV